MEHMCRQLSLRAKKGGGTGPMTAPQTVGPRDLGEWQRGVSWARPCERKKTEACGQKSDYTFQSGNWRAEWALGGVQGGEGKGER